MAIQQVATDAFGNALGQSLAANSGQMAGSASGAGEDRLGAFIEQNQGAWNQRQGNYDQMVDAFGNPTAYGRADYALLAAGPGYSGGLGQSDRDRNIARMLDMANEPEAMGFGTPRGVAPSGLVDMAPTKANAIRLGLMGPDGQTDGAWSSPVVTQPNVVGMPLPPIDAPQPPLGAAGYYVNPGFITSSYNLGVSMMQNGNLPWTERLAGLGAATLMSPMMLLEEGGRALLNAPGQLYSAGVNTSRVFTEPTTEGKVTAGLTAVRDGAFGLLGLAPLVPAKMMMPTPVLNAQEMAVGKFAGAEVNNAAAATYLGDVYSDRFVGPVKWEYFYRGDSTQRSSFLSSMTQERGAQASTEFLSSRSSGQLTDIFDAHGNVGSQGLPTIGVSKDPAVAEYFARGPYQNQNGFVTTFRIESREAEGLAFRNFENRRDVFDINPNIGRPEQEYLFRNQIDPKYIYQQRPAGSR